MAGAGSGELCFPFRYTPQKHKNTTETKPRSSHEGFSRVWRTIINPHISPGFGAEEKDPESQLHSG
jgi:hypothetical protein